MIFKMFKVSLTQPLIKMHLMILTFITQTQNITHDASLTGVVYF